MTASTTGRRSSRSLAVALSAVAAASVLLPPALTAAEEGPPATEPPTTTTTIPVDRPIDDPHPQTPTTTTPGNGSGDTPGNGNTPGNGGGSGPVSYSNEVTDDEWAEIVEGDPIAAEAITDIAEIQAELAVLQPLLGRLRGEVTAARAAAAESAEAVEQITRRRDRLADQLGAMSVFAYVHDAAAQSYVDSAGGFADPVEIGSEAWVLEMSDATTEDLSARHAATEADLAEAEAEADRLADRFAGLRDERNDTAERVGRLEARLATYERRLGVDLDQVTASYISANGMAFPVAEPYSFIDSWGYPRSGGRTHQGTDIMAPLGVPLYAIESGTVELSSSGLGGTSLWIIGDSGAAYYYAHLSGYAAGLNDGQRVAVGQVVGYNGSSGNATAGAEHLHFELHPGGRSTGAVPSYPLLSALSNAARNARQGR